MTKVRLPDGKEIGALAYNIRARNPSNILIIKLDNETRRLLSRKISHESFARQIGRDRIIWEGYVTQRGTYGFAYQGSNYIIRVDKILWNFIGPDYVVVTIKKGS